MADGFDPARRRAIFAEAVRQADITRSVIVTGSFRAGTSFVCTMLGNNGLPGTDQERFGGFWQAGPDKPEAAFQDRVSEILSTAQHGIFTAKLMWPHRNFLAQALGFARADSAAFAAIFPDARWIDIRRRDKFSQAISFWKAKLTDRWHVYADEAEPQVTYDFKAIRAAFVELSAHDLLWQDFHDQAGTAANCIVYEDFLADVDAGLGALLAALGPDHRHNTPPLTASTRLRRQGNDQSQAIRDRFLADLYKTGF
ncbi:MAG: Stf0 family sulfotransferase [Paracoccaceae bacterium]